MLIEALSTARDLGRLHEIASALIRHGMGDLVRRLRLAAALERAGRMLHWRAVEGLAARTPQERLRQLLEDLGPTFVKLGQILAGRTDLLGPEWTEELAKLQETAAPPPAEETLAQLVEDLGAPPEEIFARFQAEPLGAASIAQVYRAALEDGTEVVLKVRRPGIKEVVEADLRLLSRLAERAEREIPELRRFRPRILIRQFGRSLRDELDMRVEARNAERLRANLEDNHELTIPRVYGRWTCERLYVMDFLDGTSLARWIREGRDPGVDSRRVARIGAEAILKMVLVDGFFHADPHPGNIVVLADERVGLLDFGMIGRLSEQRRIEFLRLMLAVVERSDADVVDILLGWSAGMDTDVELLAQDCAAFIDAYNGVELKDLDVRMLLMDITSILRNNDLFMPHDVALLIKVFVTLESMGRALDPEFVIAEHMEPFARRALEEHGSPLAIMQRGTREIRRVLADLPRDLRKLVRGLSQGNLRVDIGVNELDAFGAQLNRSANRVTMGLVTAAFIVGTSIALTVSGGPRLFGLPAFALLCFLSSLVAGVWLLWSIARSGRR